MEFKEVIAARAKDPSILEKAQDGGVVTAMLVNGLEKGYIDTAIVMYRDEEWHSVPGIARTKEEIIKAAGSKYVYMSLVPKLREAAKMEDVKSIAYIGTPCQINALQTFEKAGLRDIIDKVKVKICLFCTHSWDWKTVKELADEMGVNLKDVVKMDIKGKLLFHLKDGSVAEYPLDKAEEKSRQGCKICPDFISKYADLAIGAIGSPSGWNTIIVLTDRGKEFLDLAIKSGVIETKEVTEKGLKLVNKFIERKRKEAEEHRKK